ncbi:MAG: HEAT repeat domain-containing protein [Planctomycetota bacterium]|nr:HEAT repeat domain-containing protein [Planctomycetota bacterium]
MRCRPTVPVLFAATALAGGCVTDDFRDLGEVFTPKTPRQAALEALDPYNPDLRREGVVLLANAPFGGADIYLDMYRDYVENETDPLVRAAAITALGRHGRPSDAVLIVPWLDSEVTESQNVRWTAAKALQRLHNPEVVAPMLKVVTSTDDDGEVKAAVATALGQYPEDNVFQALLVALDDRRLSVNLNAAESLFLLTGESWGTDRVAWSRWYEGLDKPSMAFKGRQAYLYPTYERDKVWFEYIAFWLHQTREQPSSPAGLVPETQRRTWSDSEGPDAGS